MIENTLYRIQVPELYEKALHLARFVHALLQEFRSLVVVCDKMLGFLT